MAWPYVNQFPITIIFVRFFHCIGQWVLSAKQRKKNENEQVGGFVEDKYMRQWIAGPWQVLISIEEFFVINFEWKMACVWLSTRKKNGINKIMQFIRRQSSILWQKNNKTVENWKEKRANALPILFQVGKHISKLQTRRLIYLFFFIRLMERPQKPYGERLRPKTETSISYANI